MPRYKVKAFDGKTLTVDAADESALDEAMQDYEKGGGNVPGGGQTEAKPIGPVSNSPDLQDAGMNVAKGMQVVGGVGAPLAAIAGGAPAAPILGGLAGAALAGAGASALMDATGAAPALRGAADKVRSVLPEPKFGGDYGVLKNFGIRVAEEFTPPGMLANALEFTPELATAYAATKGAGLGASAATGAKNLLLGTPKIPQGQEGSAFLNTVNKSMGAPEVPVQKSMEVGQFKQGLGDTRARMGAEQGDTKAFAYNSATPPENVPATVQSSIEAALQKLGVQKGKEGLAKSPEAVKALLKISKESAPMAENIGDMNAIQSQLAAKGAAARSPGSPTSVEAPFYEKAAQGIGKAIEGQIPAVPKAALDTANKAYSTMLDLEKMGYKMGTKGDFSPDRALTIWKSVKPSDKARLNQDAVRALDELLTQKGAGILGRVIEAGRQVANLQPGNAAKALFKAPPTRFNAPEQKIDPAIAKRLKVGYGATGLIPSMLSE